MYLSIALIIFLKITYFKKSNTSNIKSNILLITWYEPSRKNGLKLLIISIIVYECNS